jgi:hypothetical protein
MPLLHPCLAASCLPGFLQIIKKQVYWSRNVQLVGDSAEMLLLGGGTRAPFTKPWGLSLVRAFERTLGLKRVRAPNVGPRSGLCSGLYGIEFATLLYL